MWFIDGSSDQKMRYKLEAGDTWEYMGNSVVLNTWKQSLEKPAVALPIFFNLFFFFTIFNVVLIVDKYDMKPWYPHLFTCRCPQLPLLPRHAMRCASDLLQSGPPQIWDTLFSRIYTWMEQPSEHCRFLCNLFVILKSFLMTRHTFLWPRSSSYYK